MAIERGHFWDRCALALRALLRQRQFASAAILARTCITNGAGGWAWHMLGGAENALGRYLTASKAFSRAIELDPENVDAYCARAAARDAIGDLPGAEQDLQAALSLAPRHVQALCNLGILRERQGRNADAREVYDRILALDGRNATARWNRGALLLESNHPEEALADFDAIDAADQEPAIHLNRARALFALYRDEEALDAADSALAREPSNRRARLDRALALASIGRLGEAESAFAQVPEAAGNPRLAPLAVRTSRLILRQAVCDWREREAALALIRGALAEPAMHNIIAEPGLIFPALGFPISAAELKALGSIAMRPVRDRGTALAMRLPPLTPPARKARMRLGFFAAGLRVHPESHLVRRLFLEGDRCRFEYYLYGVNADDGSRLRAEIAAAADRFVDVSSWEAEAIARMARADGLDLAIDLSAGYVDAKPELFGARVAPVQASYLAAASTFGEGLHDYRIGDTCSTPPSEQTNWWEKLVLTWPPPWVYDDQMRCAPSGPREAHGLPLAGFVYSCMNQGFKLDPESFSVWMKLLRSVPGAVLWLLDNGDVANRNLRREAVSRGVSPERLIFAPRVPLEAHLGRLQHADLFLDSFHTNSHTTALDALWAGVPVLTLTGATMASRLATAFVRAAGLPELATAGVDAYEEKARALAADMEAAMRLKAKVRQARRESALFDTRAQVRRVEQAMAAMVERSWAGLDPDTIVIG